MLLLLHLSNSIHPVLIVHQAYQVQPATLVSFLVVKGINISSLQAQKAVPDAAAHLASLKLIE